MRSLYRAALLLAVAPGCQAFHSYRPETVQILDAETKQPISGAVVRFWYPVEDPHVAPLPSVGSTGADGIVHLRAAPYGRAGILLDASVKGYLGEQKVLAIEEVQAVEPAHWFEKVERRPPNLVLELYASPPPTVELVVPPGFRGQVKAKFDVTKESPQSAGQRAFSYQVPGSGEVAIAGPSLFRHVSFPNVRLRFADDFPLSRLAETTQVGYWWLKSEGNCHYFLIGTEAEYKALQPSTGPAKSGKKSSSGGGGQGRHGHKGQQPQPPADPGP